MKSAVESGLSFTSMVQSAAVQIDAVLELGLRFIARCVELRTIVPTRFPCSSFVPHVSVEPPAPSALANVDVVTLAAAGRESATVASISDTCHRCYHRTKACL